MNLDHSTVILRRVNNFLDNIKIPLDASIDLMFCLFTCVSDLPSVVSGDRLAFLDPHSIYIKQGAFGCQFEVKPQLLEQYNDQFSPYEDVLDCKVSNGYYDGTLFRFPLRNNPSQLSSKLYTVEQVRELLNSFKEEAPLILLFLKHVEKIIVYETDDEESEKPLFSVQVKEDCLANVRGKKQAFIQRIDDIYVGKISGDAVMDVFLTVQELGHDSGAQDHGWVVCNYFSTRNLRLQHLASRLKLAPWMGVACPVTLQDSKALEKEGGRIYCFLPLPPDVHTGLPVHIHGAFGLTDNRRGLKWPGPECRDDAAEWNELLVEQVGSVAYQRALQFPMIVTNQLHANFIYTWWPNMETVQRCWVPMLEEMFRSILGQNVLWTDCSGGAWIGSQDAIVDRLRKSSPPLSEEVREAVVRFLKQADQPVVVLPDHMLSIIDTYGNDAFNQISPKVVRQLLKKKQLGNWNLSSMPREDKLLVLEYVVSDNTARYLTRVPLLPLADGTFGEFCQIPSQSAAPVYVASEEHPQSILPNFCSR